ncbi:O-phospho-L-seryl-tRNA:Cys-tRNA synthase [Candidatus Bathyarchaeota archaeon]|nr:O-phospho-L-seryl-tRNA:Cys-tRNA synthase [Candidatus Bathyarchaeota archaeon]
MDENELSQFRNLCRENDKGYINLQPIQRGGILPPESKKVLQSYGDGYSLCDFCFTGRMDEIENPPVSKFIEFFSKFVGMDVSIPTGSSREGARLIISQLASRIPKGKEPVLVLDGLAHYSSFLAAEAAGVSVVEVPHDGNPTYLLQVDQYAAKIDEIMDSSKQEMVGALLTHSDYLYGNVTDPKVVGRICHDKGVPFILNGAYTIGIMPFKGKHVGVDFLTASGHKSMASSGPIGMVACASEYRELLLPPSQIKGDWSGRTFPHKIHTVLGCPSVYGAPLLTLMSSFPRVVERATATKWKEEVAKARLLAGELEHIQGVMQLGCKPHEHTLMQFNTPAFQDIAREHPKKGYFLYRELKERGIVGIFPGMVKSIKLNTYGLSRKQVQYVARCFKEIALEHGVDVSPA